MITDRRLIVHLLFYLYVPSRVTFLSRVTFGYNLDLL